MVPAKPNLYGTTDEQDLALRELETTEPTGERMALIPSNQSTVNQAKITEPARAG